MSDKLTIKAENQEFDVSTNKSDVAAAFVSSILGAAPFIGPLAVEVITATIPNQKIERVALAIRVLQDRLKYVEEDVLNEKFKSERFADLLEDALPQMARALTDERRAYLANLLSKSLTDETLDHLGQKKLLSMLNQFNDAEIVLLHFYAVRRGDKEAADKMLEQYPFIRGALRSFEPDHSDEKELMFREYRGTLYMASLLMGGVKEEYPSPMAYLLLKYIQPDRVACG